MCAKQKSSVMEMVFNSGPAPGPSPLTHRRRAASGLMECRSRRFLKAVVKKLDLTLGCWVMQRFSAAATACSWL